MSRRYAYHSVSGLALVLAALPSIAQAAQAAPQDDIDESVSQPVVQAIPNQASMNLNAALARLGKNPRDLDALLDAGNAALGMGDVDAAVGFYSRADQISPGNQRVRAGLAGALVRNQNPFDAIPMFDEAERSGAVSSSLAADRGLAYDLVGDNDTAQRYYRQALNAAPSDEVSRRYALSLAISGDKRGSDAAIAPLLQRQDKPALRTRAFALAILGLEQDAISLAYAALPRDIAASISPYLRYMPRLTHAQQAAAANFGHFPRAAEIGHDDPRLAQYARPRPVVAEADATLIPKGEPLGRNDRNRNSRNDKPVAKPAAIQSPPVRIAPPEPQTGRDIAAVPSLALETPVAKPRLAAPVQATALPPARVAAAPLIKSDVIAVAPSPTPVAIQAPPLSAEQTSPGFDLAKVPASAAIVTAPVAVSAASSQPAPVLSPPPKARNLADAFAEFAAPQRDVAPAAGAVDMRRLAPSRPALDPKLAAAKTPPPPSHPSRIWVQVATGRDKAGLNFDWRRMAREATEVFRGKRPNISSWGQTNRLLAGPFESTAAANSFIAQLRHSDIVGAFVWTSPAGQVVDTLDGK